MTEKFFIPEVQDESGDLSRRDFLKLGAKAAVGALVMSESSVEGSEQQIKNVEYEAASFNGDEAHNSANVFEDRVGNALRENWKNGKPSKVTHPSVKISARGVGGKTEFKFSWHCDIESCEAKDADRHFSRRGTFLSGRTLGEAKSKVEKNLHDTGKVNEMMQGFDRLYGKHKMPTSFVSESSLQTKDGAWWYVKEFFCTANEKTNEITD